MLDYVNWGTVFSGAIALIALIMSTMLALNLHFGLWRDWSVRYSALLFICLILYSGAMLLEQTANGVPGSAARIVLEIGCFGDYLLSGMLAYAFAGFLLAITDPNARRSPQFLLLNVLGALHIVLIILDRIFHLFYYLDQANVYCRSSAYPFSLVVPGLMLLLGFWILLRCRKTVPRGERLELWCILLIPFAGLILQGFVQNVTPIAALAAALMLYTVLTRQQIRDLHRQQEENLRLQTEVLLSEIQPHFMYNTLGAVAELCDSDPARAMDTTLLFSNYLQGVMRSLGTKMVSFSQELEQLRMYLDLDKVRFEDALTVEYRIEATDFQLPSMCLQPLVENAIRHGVRKNKEGRGTVTISSRACGDCWEISVADDGPGFEALRQPDRDRIQVGLNNVRERLRLICGGSLELVSQPGAGTVATVRIPKKEGI